MFLEEARGRSLFKRIFSNILEKVERRIMDLYEAGSCVGNLKVIKEYKNKSYCINFKLLKIKTK